MNEILTNSMTLIDEYFANSTDGEVYEDLLDQGYDPSEEEEKSLYCPSCDGCGCDGCCNPLNCAYHHMVLDKDEEPCYYGETNYKSIEFYSNLGKELFNHYSKDEEAVKIFDECWNKTYKEN
jgi:hypothetical protein